MSDVMYTDIPMTKENKLAILKEARKILSDESAFTQGELKMVYADQGPRYCVLGAVEQATYTLNLAIENADSFGGDPDEGDGAYAIGRDLSLYEYAERVFNDSPYGVNDSGGYDKAIEMLDGYIAELETS